MQRGLQVKQVSQEAFLLLPVTRISIPGAVTGVIIIVVFATTIPWKRRSRSHRGRIRALNDFVQFSAIQPDATALRAEVDFYSLTVGHGERNKAFWTVHEMLDEGLVGLVKILEASDIVRIFSSNNINYGTINSRL